MMDTFSLCEPCGNRVLLSAKPAAGTDMLEADMNKLSKLWSRGRDSAREQESQLKEYLL
jgi:hypothetical protein